MGHMGSSLSDWSLKGDYKFREPFRGQQEFPVEICMRAGLVKGSDLAHDPGIQ